MQCYVGVEVAVGQRPVMPSVSMAGHGTLAPAPGTLPMTPTVSSLWSSVTWWYHPIFSSLLWYLLWEINVVNIKNKTKAFDRGFITTDCHPGIMVVSVAIAPEQLVLSVCFYINSSVIIMISVMAVAKHPIRNVIINPITQQWIGFFG